MAEHRKRIKARHLKAGDVVVGRLDSGGGDVTIIDTRFDPPLVSLTYVNEAGEQFVSLIGMNNTYTVLRHTPD